MVHVQVEHCLQLLKSHYCYQNTSSIKDSFYAIERKDHQLVLYGLILCFSVFERMAYRSQLYTAIF